MSASWQIGTVNIFVSERESAREIKRAEIIALDATGSTYHFFGAGSRHYSVKGLVIGDADLDSLETYAINNTAFTFVTPWGSITNCKLDKNVKASAMKYSGGSIDGVAYTVDSTPIYDVQLEVIPT
jgi:hypothetical protein